MDRGLLKNHHHVIYASDPEKAVAFETDLLKRRITLLYPAGRKGRAKHRGASRQRDKSCGSPVDAWQLQELEQQTRVQEEMQAKRHQKSPCHYQGYDLEHPFLCKKAIRAAKLEKFDISI